MQGSRSVCYGKNSTCVFCMVYFIQVYDRCQKLLLCLSPYRTLELMDKLCEGHDEVLHKWRCSLLNYITKNRLVD